MLKGAETLFAGLLMGAVMVHDAVAANYSYRYRDDNGAIHIGYTVPPEFVENGYEVLNENGMMIDVVLPKSVLDERSAKLLKEAEARHQLELQASKDEALLRFYSSPEDVERVRERKLQELQHFIEIQRANIMANRKRLTVLQGQAASMERNGQPVTVKTLKALDTLAHKISDAKQAIKLKEAEKERTWLAFELDIERLNELLGKQRKDRQAVSP